MKGTIMAIATFGALIARYLHEQIDNPKTRDNYARVHRQYLTTWEADPLERITRPTVRRLHLSLASTPDQANRVLQLIKQAYSWAQRTDDAQGEALWNGSNPGSGIRPHRTYSRIRVMADHELGRLLAALESHTLSPKLRAFLTVLLCTGADRAKPDPWNGQRSISTWGAG
jgi:hypothetical protein